MSCEDKQELLDAAFEKIGHSLHETGSLSAHDLSKEDASLLYTLAHSLYQAGDYERAKPVFHKLVTARPLEGRNWYGLASTLQMLHDFDNASVAWYMTALFSDSDPAPQLHAAECLLSMERYSEASTALDRAREICSGDPKILERIEAMRAVGQDEPHYLEVADESY